MPKHRYLFEFNATAGNAQTAGSDAGWTESWYDATDLTDEDAEDKGRLMAGGRSQVLTGGWQVSALRISRLDPTNNLLRKGRLIRFAPGGYAGSYDMGAPMNEQPWDAINLSVSTVGGTRRAFLMRGIGGDVIAPSGRYAAPPRFIPRSAVYAASLNGTGAMNLPPGPATPVALRTRGLTNTVAISNVLTVAPMGVNLITNTQRPLIRVPFLTIQAGNQVQITAVSDMTGINGQWVVSQIQADPTNNQFIFAALMPRRRNTVGGTYSSGGTARYWNWFLDPVTGFTIGDGASRRTGRPPQQRRGRRSSRRP